MNSIFYQIKYPYSEKFIKVKDYEIAYIDEGNSENILLFIHGLGSYLKAWDRNIPELKKHFRCIALDLPGYGKSSKQVHSGKVSFYTEMLKEFISKLRLKNVSLVGHSMGGQIAASYVISFPDEIKRLILVAPAGFETFNSDEIELLKKIISPEILFKTSDNQVRLNYQMNFFKMPVEAEEMISDRIAIKDDEEFFNHCSVVSNSLFGLLKAPVFERLNEINIPTLVLFGKNDLLIPNKSIHQTTTEEIALIGSSQIKDNKLLLLNDCGHFFAV
ncbi:MAG: alpha/beta hydrolase [Ignavibacteriales bacterium]|nr:alpha/beta hydrolase [Ignavibacteriales bacterium]